MIIKVEIMKNGETIKGEIAYAPDVPEEYEDNIIFNLLAKGTKMANKKADQAD